VLPLLLAVSLGAPLSSVLAQEYVAWALVNPAGQGATFTPFSAFQHAPFGGTVTVSRGSGKHALLAGRAAAR